MTCRAWTLGMRSLRLEHIYVLRPASILQLLEESLESEHREEKQATLRHVALPQAKFFASSPDREPPENDRAPHSNAWGLRNSLPHHLSSCQEPSLRTPSSSIHSLHTHAMFRSALSSLRAPAQQAGRSSLPRNAAAGLPRLVPVNAAAAGQLSSFQRAASSKPTEMTVRDALNSAMEEEMLRDDKVFVLGEEVARCEYAS